MSPIGLDVGAHSVRLLQLERRGNGWIAAAASRSLPTHLSLDGAEGNAAVAEAVNAMLATGAFHGRRVVSSLPATSLNYKNLRLPRMPADELRAAVEWEAADRLQFRPEQVQCQFFHAGEVRQGEDVREEVILLAAPRSTVEQHLETLLNCGLAPVAIEAAPAALARLGGPMRTVELARSAAEVIVDIGYASTKVLMTRQGRVIFFKLIEAGGRHLDDLIADALKLSPAEAADARARLRAHTGDGGASSVAQPGRESEPLFESGRLDTVQRAVVDAARAVAGQLAEEIGLCLRYYSVTFRGPRPERLQVAGGEAANRELLSALAEAMRIEIRPIEPLRGVDLSRATEIDASRTAAWSVATGLAMRTDDRGIKRGAA